MNNQKDNNRNKKITYQTTTSTQKTNATQQPEKENQEIPDEIKQKYFVNPPYFDFLYAEEELGFNFADFSKNQFSDFLQSIYVTELISLRKAYISRNIVQVRFLSHKFKSPFR